MTEEKPKEKKPEKCYAIVHNGGVVGRFTAIDESDAAAKFFTATGRKPDEYRYSVERLPDVSEEVHEVVSNDPKPIPEPAPPAPVPDHGKKKKAMKAEGDSDE